jgi:hypothetical protein
MAEIETVVESGATAEFRAESRVEVTVDSIGSRAWSKG